MITTALINGKVLYYDACANVNNGSLQEAINWYTRIGIKNYIGKGVIHEIDGLKQTNPNNEEFYFFTKEHFKQSDNVQERNMTNEMRIFRAETAIEAAYEDDIETNVIDLLADLMHLARKQKLNFNKLLFTAKECFNEEK